MGRSDLFLKLEIIKKIIGIVLLVATMKISVEAMAYSLLISSVYSQIINSWPNRKLLHYGYLEQLKDILPGILLAVGMGVCVYFIGKFPLPYDILLIIQVVVGGIIYLMGSIIFRLDSFEYICEMVKSYLKSRAR